MLARLDHRQIARLIAVGRLLIGGTMTVVPGFAGRVWIGDAAREPAAKLLLRALGVRDLALGAGTLHALQTGGDVRPWVAWGGVSDAVDAGATVLAIRRIPLTRALPVLAVAVQAAAASAVAANHLD